MSRTHGYKPVLNELMGPELLTTLLHAGLVQGSEPHSGVLYYSTDTLNFYGAGNDEVEIWERSIGVRELLRELTFKMQTQAAELVANTYIDEELPGLVADAAADIAQRIVGGDMFYDRYLTDVLDAQGQPEAFVQLRITFSVARPPESGPAVWRKHPAFVVFVLDTYGYTTDPLEPDTVVTPGCIERFSTTDLPST